MWWINGPYEILFFSFVNILSESAKMMWFCLNDKKHQDLIVENSSLMPILKQNKACDWYRRKNVEQNAHAVKTNASLILGLNLDLKKLVDIHSCQKMFAQQQIGIVYAFARDIFFAFFYALCLHNSDAQFNWMLSCCASFAISFWNFEIGPLKDISHSMLLIFFSSLTMGIFSIAFRCWAHKIRIRTGRGEGMYSGENISTQWNGKSFLVCLLW